jgi:hypothetical protein
MAVPGEDFSTPYSHELWAFWSGRLETARNYAHEVGHLLGFGDDYRPPLGLHLPGRQDSLMANGNRVDQNLADRLADVIKNSGQPLPACWHIVGNFKKVADSAAMLPEGQGRGEYHDELTASFSLMPQPDGTLKGSGQATYRMENLRAMPDGCRMRHFVAPSTWAVELGGEVKTLPDGSIEVTLSAPAQGPSVSYQYTHTCPPSPFSTTQTMTVPFSLPPGPYKLVNGLAKQSAGATAAQGGVGQGSWEITLEQKQSQPR